MNLISAMVVLLSVRMTSSQTWKCVPNCEKQIAGHVNRSVQRYSHLLVVLIIEPVRYVGWLMLLVSIGLLHIYWHCHIYCLICEDMKSFFYVDVIIFVIITSPAYFTVSVHGFHF